jgi:nucleoside-diphosphate-sugar epimerase
MAVLVAGAGGYIGVPLIEALLARGHQVVALDRYFFGKEKLGNVVKHPNLRILTDDIREFDPALLEGVDAVIDLAGLSNDLSAEIDPNVTESINYEGGKRLARLAKQAGVKRYVYVSSASVYGHGGGLALSEESECRPLTLYAKYKYGMESHLNKLGAPDFEVVIFRLGTVFGLAPRMRFDLVVNIMAMRAWKDRKIQVNGNGEQWRPFVHVKDVVEALLLGLERPSKDVAGEIFNVGSSQMNYQISGIARLVADAFPRTKVQRIPGNADARNYNVSFAKIEKRLNFKATRPIDVGIAEIQQALEKKVISAEDPTCYTLQWYRTLIDWDLRIKQVAMYGRVI